MRFHERTDRHDFHHRFQELVREPPRNECSQLMRTMETVHTYLLLFGLVIASHTEAIFGKMNSRNSSLS